VNSRFPDGCDWALEEVPGAGTAVLFFLTYHASDHEPLWERLPITSTPATHRIWIRDRRYALYHRGVAGLGDSIAETAASLRRVLDGIGARRVVAVGGSLGGYAALVHGALLGADEIVGFGAPTTWLPEHMPELGDERVHIEIQELVAEGRLDRRNGDARPLLERASPRLEVLPGVELHPEPGRGHAVAWRLRAAGRLSPLLEAAAGVRLSEELGRAVEAPFGGDAGELDVVVVDEFGREGMREAVRAGVEDALGVAPIVVSPAAGDGRPAVPSFVPRLRDALHEAGGRHVLLLRAGFLPGPALPGALAGVLHERNAVLLQHVLAASPGAVARPAFQVPGLLTRPLLPAGLAFGRRLYEQHGPVDPRFSLYAVWELLIRWTAAGAELRLLDDAPLQGMPGALAGDEPQRLADWLRRLYAGTPIDHMEIADVHLGRVHTRVINRHLDTFAAAVQQAVPQLELSLLRTTRRATAAEAARRRAEKASASSPY
jgi:hypothetical protein